MIEWISEWMQKILKLETRGGKGSEWLGGDMAQTMYAHMNKQI
jgi:hypothetical protein